LVLSSRARRRLRGRGQLLARGGRWDEAAALLWEALERYEQAGARAGSGRGCGPSASVLARAGPGTGRRAAGRAWPRPSGQCRWWP